MYARRTVPRFALASPSPSCPVLLPTQLLPFYSNAEHFPPLRDVQPPPFFPSADVAAKIDDVVFRNDACNVELIAREGTTARNDRAKRLISRRASAFNGKRVSHASPSTRNHESAFAVRDRASDSVTCIRGRQSIAPAERSGTREHKEIGMAGQRGRGREARRDCL